MELLAWQKSAYFAIHIEMMDESSISGHQKNHLTELIMSMFFGVTRLRRGCARWSGVCCGREEDMFVAMIECFVGCCGGWC